jgi:hypothetical protein
MKCSQVGGKSSQEQPGAAFSYIATSIPNSRNLRKLGKEAAREAE